MVGAVQALERARLGLDTASVPRRTTVAGLGLLCVLSLWLRTRVLGGGFWIDEGISVGIAHHPLTAIPHLLREDGSPPLYYLLLHVWIGAFGDGERATHALSLPPALACVPLGYWAARSIFGRTAGWICAALAALDPYLTYYGQETRMYTLVACLSIAAAAAFVHGVVRGRRRYLPLLVATLDLILYTHNWGLFLCLGLAAATAAVARDRWRPAALAGAATALLYVPWLPILLDQARHTGAPWTLPPSVHALVLGPGFVISGDAPLAALALAGGAGLAAVLRRRADPARAPALALLAAVGAAELTAWVFSQLTPAWASRYLAVLLGPLLLLAAAGLARAGRLGLVALALVVFLWAGYSAHDDKSNVRAIAHGVEPYLQPGDLVLSTHPEQVPVLRYYLGGGLRFATQLGAVRDPRVMDWRDALDRLRAVSVGRELEPLLASLRPGQHLVVVSPVFRDYRAWRAPWTRLVYDTSRVWTRTVAADPRLREVTTVGSDEVLEERNYWKPLQAAVYLRRE
ncbi:MAG TPA: glycosyltransferase family 39 protein [Gaiellaceae bacterium]|nr:glycosyltransferase family 39 protein [Gaiellaceae bacterium]